MQHKQIIIDGKSASVFALTKREIEAFRQTCRSSKSPVDERVVRFVPSRGLIWATDRSMLVECEASPHNTTARDCTNEIVVAIDELRKFGTKVTAKHIVLFNMDDFSVRAVEKKDLHDGVDVDAPSLGTLTDVKNCELTTGNLDVVMGSFPEAPKSGAVKWKITSRFGHVLSAVAKATGDASSLVANAPSSSRTAMRWVIDDDMDGARWTVVVMPMVPMG